MVPLLPLLGQGWPRWPLHILQPFFLLPSPLQPPQQGRSIRKQHLPSCLLPHLHLPPFLLPTSGCGLCSGYAGIEKQPISGFGWLFRRCILFSLYLVQAAKILYIYGVTMADKWDQMSLVLEQEEKELQEAMRAEVGTTSLCTTNSSKMKFLKVFTGADIIAQHTARKEPKF